MSLGNFKIGSSVIIPLQVLEGGYPSESNLQNVVVKEVIKPDLTKDSSFPQNMILENEEKKIYFYKYTPNSAGNYIVILSLSINSVEYSQIESFYISEGSFTSGSAPMAKAISNYKSYT